MILYLRLRSYGHGARLCGFLASLLLCLPAPRAFGLDTPNSAGPANARPAPLPIEQMRAVAYTKDFAKRFALPDPQPGTEPSGGIQAMEFAVEDAKAKYPHKRFATYQCVLKLYLDNQLPVAYPEEGVAGTQRMLIFPAHFFVRSDPGNKQQPKLSPNDGQHFNERNGRYNRMTMLASPEYDHPEHTQGPPKKSYGGHGIFYEEYHRDLFPGIAYLKIDMTCPTYSWMDEVDTVQIWLKREGAKDYRKQLRMEPQDFLKFTISSKIYRQILGWRKDVAAYNKPLIEKLDAERRSK